MNRNEFNRFIAGIDLPGQADLEELRELTGLFPWFHAAHMLLLRGLKDNSDIRFDSQLKVSALSVADREVLYHYLFLSPEEGASGDVAASAMAVPVEEEPVTVAAPPEVEVTAAEIPVEEEPVTVAAPPEVEVTAAEAPMEEEPVTVAVPPEVEAIPAAAPVEEEPVFNVTPAEEEITMAAPPVEEAAMEVAVSGDVVVTDMVASDNPEAEVTEKVRTREELMAEIEARLLELEQIRIVAEEQVARQEPEPVAEQESIAESVPETVHEYANEPVPEPEPVLPEPEPVITGSEPEPVIPEPESVITGSEPEPVIPEPEPVITGSEPEPVIPEAEPMPHNMPEPEHIPVIEIEWQPEQEPVSESEYDPGPEEDELLELISDEPAGQEEPVRQLTPADLIDRFIRTSPTIERLTPGNLQPVKDLSVESTEEHGKFITETLAKIYINQGYYSRAINIYEKLSLHYPEKSAYFASRIEKIKDLIK